MKIYNDLALNIATSRFFTMPIKIFKLLAAPNNKDITDTLQALY